jgi:anti-sigma regulatory factor (Ser/Thr protein kinase)
MPLSSITIPPSPDQVRTVRMVAGAAARRGRVPEELIDEVRLAVGEAVARVVLRHRRAELDDDVRVNLRDDPEAFEIEVFDRAPVEMPDDDGGISVALTQSLVPQCSALPTPDGTQVFRLVWPLGE